MRRVKYLPVLILLFSLGLLFASYRYWEDSRQNIRFGENYPSYFYSFLFALDDLLIDEELFIIPMGTSGDMALHLYEVDDYKILILKFDNEKYFSESSVNVLSELSKRVFENLKLRMEYFSEHNKREEVREKIFELLLKYQRGIPEEYYDAIMELSHAESRASNENADFIIELPEDETLTMIWIEPGEFLMGSPSSAEWHLDSEGPQTQVRLTHGYWLGATPITQGQWEALMGNNPSNFKESGSNAPVETVSWNDAMEFCRKLTERERTAGRLPQGYKYALPSEAQWEYAVRAGTQTPWWFGYDAEDFSLYAWFASNSGMRTHPVGQKSPNPLGLYDVYGNVSELTRSWYGDYPGGSKVDYEGPMTGTRRVVRGGAWFHPPLGIRSAIRARVPPDRRDNWLGFRIALVPVSKE
ncbi:MAG: formylglycine-generating enzyme family protein [Opitutales bacterium]|nr:formylglycine-generating enzyme family protein [Opitutales bacterium]MCH8541816.1 formylglycine-generating enzyme family protein [Opitutales bacterium]